MNPEAIIAKNPALKKLAAGNPKLKWIIANEYQRQVRDRTKLVEAMLKPVMTFTDVVAVTDALHMTRANEQDRILVSFRPPASMFDMSNAAISMLHRLVKPRVGAMMMLIDRGELIIYKN